MTITTVRSHDGPTWLTYIIALDVQALGGVQGALRWLEKNPRKEGTLVIAVLGQNEDTRPLGPHVDGITVAPEPGTNWDEYLFPIIKAIEEPNYRDTFEESETQGGVPMDEFLERNGLER